MKKMHVFHNTCISANEKIADFHKSPANRKHTHLSNSIGI